MASPEGLAKSLNAFVEDAKTVVTGPKAPSSGADQAVASSSTDCTPSPTSPAPGEESEENKAYVRGYKDALKDIPTEHADSPATVIKDQESEAATEIDASQRTELGDSPSKDGSLKWKCNYHGYHAEEGERTASQAGIGIQDDEQPNLLARALKDWPDDCVRLVLVLLRRSSPDVFFVSYTPRGIPITNRDMMYAIMDELNRRFPMEEPREQSNLRAASGRDSRTSREVADKGKGRDDEEDDVDSSPISPEEYERLITVVTNNMVEAISLPIPLEDIPCRGGPRASLADIREAIMTVLIQRGLRELGEEVVCTPAGQDDTGIHEGDLTSSLKVLYEGIYDQEVAKMVRALNRPIPIPGSSQPADEVRERLLLEFRVRCWCLVPSLMRARWENDQEDASEQRTYEVVVESLGGRPAPDLSHRDSSRMSDASEHERRADERRPLDLGSSRSWTREGENGILGRQPFSRPREITLRQWENGVLGRQPFSRLRDFTSRQWDGQGDPLSQDRTPRLGDLRPRARSLDDRSLSERDEDLASELGSPLYRSSSRASDDFHERTREQDRPGFGLGLGLGRLGLSLSSLRDDRQEREVRDASRDWGFGGQRFGGGLGSGSKLLSRDDDFSDVQEARGSRFGGQRFGGGLGSRSRSRSRDNDFSDAQEPQGLRFGGGLGSEWGRRSFGDDYADAQGIRDFSPRDRERYDDLMEQFWG